jgi:hypothetical protein
MSNHLSQYLVFINLDDVAFGGESVRVCERWKATVAGAFDQGCTWVRLASVTHSLSTS